MTAVPVPVALLLDRLAAEADQLAQTTLRTEAALHRLLDGMRFLPPEVGTDLQRIDLVRQSLEDLSRLLSLAARSVPEGPGLAPAALRSRTRLASMAARVTGALGGDGAAAGGEDDLDLF